MWLVGTVEPLRRIGIEAGGLGRHLPQAGVEADARPVAEVGVIGATTARGTLRLPLTSTPWVAGRAVKKSRIGMGVPSVT